MNRKSQKATVIGITGGIGSGKSFTTEEFIKQGAIKFDADVEARELYKKASVSNTIKKRWPEVFDQNGNINRGMLAEIVFHPDKKGADNLKFLNATIHPELTKNFKKWLEERTGQEIVILDAPLLFETGWDRFVDYIVFVDAPKEVRRKRTIKRGWDNDEIDKRESRQIPLLIKKSKANYIVDASKDVSHIDRQVADILKRIKTKECVE